MRLAARLTQVIICFALLFPVGINSGCNYPTDLEFVYDPKACTGGCPELYSCFKVCGKGCLFGAMDWKNPNQGVHDLSMCCAEVRLGDVYGCPVCPTCPPNLCAKHCHDILATTQLAPTMAANALRDPCNTLNESNFGLIILFCMLLPIFVTLFYEVVRKRFFRRAVHQNNADNRVSFCGRHVTILSAPTRGEINDGARERLIELENDSAATGAPGVQTTNANEELSTLSRKNASAPIPITERVDADVHRDNEDVLPGFQPEVPFFISSGSTVNPGSAETMPRIISSGSAPSSDYLILAEGSMLSKEDYGAKLVNANSSAGHTPGGQSKVNSAEELGGETGGVFAMDECLSPEVKENAGYDPRNTSAAVHMVDNFLIESYASAVPVAPDGWLERINDGLNEIMVPRPLPSLDWLDHEPIDHDPIYEVPVARPRRPAPRLPHGRLSWIDENEEDATADQLAALIPGLEIDRDTDEEDHGHGLCNGFADNRNNRG